VPYTDIGSLAQGTGERGQLYIDYCHLTPAGARRVAERMLPAVLDKILERLAPESDFLARTGPA
jgi:lysophospholipase L1-like esterase